MLRFGILVEGQTIASYSKLLQDYGLREVSSGGGGQTNLVYSQDSSQFPGVHKGFSVVGIKCREESKRGS
jgi:hypothetical protein